MYKDNGTVDVELLADVGYIAHRLRNLDAKLSALGPNPLDANTTEIRCPNATNTTGSSSNRCHNNSDSTSIITTEQLKTTVESEKTIIDFYEKHQEYHLDKERATVANYYRDKTHSKLYQLTSNGEDTMNNSSPNRCANNVSDSGSALELTSNEEKTSCESLIESKASPTFRNNDGIASGLQRNSAGRGSISQPMPEIQISNTEDSTTKTISTSIEQISSNSPLKIAESYLGRGSGGSCGHYCSGWQSSICTDNLTDEDIRNLVIELKSKVDFTERMNWLCKYLYSRKRLNFYVFCLKVDR